MTSKLQHKLGIDYPIFQAPMAGGIVCADFVAQVSAFGMLGSIPSGYLTLPQTREFIDAVKERTRKPFSLNLFVDYMVYNDCLIDKPNEIVAIERDLEKESPSSFQITPPPSMDDLVQLAIDRKVPALSTTFGLLSHKHVNALKAANVKVMTTVNSVYEMELALETRQPDVLIYQNDRAGGHKGGFTPLPHSEEAVILNTLRKYSDVPCVIAGAIVDKNDIDRALTIGFDGVQIGTGFLMTQESSANDAYKMAILCNRQTAFTTTITGRPARGLKNRLAALSIQENLGFPYMHYATSSLRKTAKAHNNIDYQSLWCGDGIAKIKTLATLNDYMKGLVS